MEKMQIYQATRVCPQTALRTIQAGKLKGKSDINPQWRIEQLTVLFGPCGEGWKTENEKFWNTPGAAGEVIAWCSLDLLWKMDNGEWSAPVSGIGGSMLVDTQKGHLASNDEAYKMAKTDAISVACKQLGFAADVYWANGGTKYERNETRDAVPPAPATARPAPAPAATRSAPPPVYCEGCKHPILPVACQGNIYTTEEIVEKSQETFHRRLCWECMKREREKANS